MQLSLAILLNHDEGSKWAATGSDRVNSVVKRKKHKVGEFFAHFNVASFWHGLMFLSLNIIHHCIKPAPIEGLSSRYAQPFSNASVYARALLHPV